MKKIRRGFVWLFMLWKRMLKRPGYVILLALIAVGTSIFSAFAGQSNNLIRVSVYTDNEEMKAIFKESEGIGTIIKYEYFDSEEQAKKAVTDSGYDAAWILEGTPSEAAQKYIERGKPMVRVFQREDTVFLRLAGERLYATLYPHISKAIYDEFMKENFASADKNVTDQYYFGQSESRSIIDIEFNNSDSEVSDLNLLASPIRGILAVAVFLCAYSALMSFKKDREAGLFAGSPENRYVYIEAAYIMTSLFNAAVLALLSMGLAGVFTAFGTEILLMFTYMILCTVFCIVLGELLDNIGVLGAIMPIVVILMLVLCPVFINLTDLPAVQYILPPYYYLTSFRNMEFLLCAVAYVPVSAAVYVLIRIGKKAVLLLKRSK